MKRLSRYIYHFVTAALTCAVMASCADRMPEMPDASDATRGYFFVLDNGRSNGTRASITSDLTTVADDGDIVGAFNLGNPADPKNVQYAVRNVADRQVLVPVVEGTELTKQTTDYLFYYPYDPEMTLEKARNLSHQVSANQFEQEDFEASDLLWDVATATTDQCTVALDHAMASVTIVVQIEDNDFFDKVRLMGQPVSASGLDLTVKGIESMDYDVDADNVADEITAFYAPYSENGDHYRAVLPANRTIPAGTKLIRYTSKRDGEKTFTLKQDLELKPGYNYVFTLLRKNNPAPDVSDDDSWVLDVKDPDTGRSVGLLCREYLRWNQDDTLWSIVDDPTSPTGNGKNNSAPQVNSQAWVFYNLQADGKTPDLSRGTVLRFVKDVRKAFDQGIFDDVNSYAWPKPHVYSATGHANEAFGMFLADHGHKWENYGSYGDNSREHTEYYMHGATLTWDGVKNRLASFAMPEMKITNEQAKESGHIAIPENGMPYVSYSPYSSTSKTDVDGNKVGYTLPHCLIDVRENLNGDIERRAYPLVKIGFNQFWMSKSFRAKTMTDGSPIINYNEIGDGNSVIWSKRIKMEWKMDIPEAGYVYPMLPQHNMDQFSGKDAIADPYTEFQGNLQYPDHALEMPLLYNYRALLDDRIVPASVEDVAIYRRPSLTDYERLHKYLGKQSTLKLMSNQIQTRNRGTAVESPHDAFIKGKYLLTSSFNLYPGNVSGFNLKSHGRIEPYNGISGNGDGNFWIFPGDDKGYFDKNEYTKGMTLVTHHSWNCWDKDGGNRPIIEGFLDKHTHNFPVNSNGWENDLNLSQNEVARFCTFAQIRFFLEFKNQTYTTGAPAMMRRPATRSNAQSRTVYVPVDM